MEVARGRSSPDEETYAAVGMGDSVENWSGSTLFTRTRSVKFILILYTICVQFQPSEPYLVPFLTRIKQFSNAQLMQVTYGVGSVADLVLSSYIYLLVPEKDYQVMAEEVFPQNATTSYTQASSLVSYMVAAELGQSLVDHGASLVTLLLISIISVGLACLVSLFLPREKSEDQLWEALSCDSDASNHQGFFKKVKETWRGKNLRLLSFWWVFGTAGFAMIPNYGTSLFDSIDHHANTYGHVLAASQGAACIGALAAVYVSDFAARGGGLVYIIGSFVVGFLCIVMAWWNTLWIVYPTYVVAIGMNQLLLALIYVQAAKSLSNQEFIFLFSFNAVAGLTVQSGIQAVVILFQLSITNQFYTFGGYCMALGVLFGIFCHENYMKTGKMRLVPADDELGPLL